MVYTQGKTHNAGPRRGGSVPSAGQVSDRDAERWVQCGPTSHFAPVPTDRQGTDNAGPRAGRGDPSAG